MVIGHPFGLSAEGVASNANRCVKRRSSALAAAMVERSGTATPEGRA